ARAAAYGAGREHAGQAGLQQVGVPAELLPGGPATYGPAELRAGDHEAVAVQLDGPGQPLRVRLGSDENEQSRSGQRVPARRDEVLDHDPLESFGAVDLPE